jgi:hypothetical protein
MAMSSGRDGWYIKLDRIRGFDEYVSAKPMLIGDMLLVPTFTTTKFDLAGAADICKATTKMLTGYSRIYALNLKDGAASFWVSQDSRKKTKYIQLDGLKITGMTKVDNNGKTSVLASFDDLDEGKRKDTGQKAVSFVDGFNAISIAMPPASAPINVSSGDTVIYYWSKP